MDTKTMMVDTSHAILITKQDNLLTVRETDWNRLKRLVSSCKISIEWWSIAASVFFSFSGSAVLAIFTLPLGESTVNVSVIIMTLAISTAILGVVCVIAAIGKGQNWNNKIDEVKQSIADIEKLLNE